MCKEGWTTVFYEVCYLLSLKCFNQEVSETNVDKYFLLDFNYPEMDFVHINISWYIICSYKTVNIFCGIIKNLLSAKDTKQ